MHRFIRGEEKNGFQFARRGIYDELGLHSALWGVFNGEMKIIGKISLKK